MTEYEIPEDSGKIQIIELFDDPNWAEMSTFNPKTAELSIIRCILHPFRLAYMIRITAPDGRETTSKPFHLAGAPAHVYEEHHRTHPSMKEYLPDENGWRPIRSAPKDGTDILLRIGNFVPTVGAWQTYPEDWGIAPRWFEDLEGYYETDEEAIDHLRSTRYEPDNWMPLP